MVVTYVVLFTGYYAKDFERVKPYLTIFRQQQKELFGIIRLINLFAI
jgi:hypothetical protein